MKGAGYHDFERRDVIEMIPTTARKVLDLGCGSGRMGEALKQRQSCHVTGVDCVDAGAGSRLDEFVQRDLNIMPSEAVLGSGYDCVVAADVLEHLEDPDRILRIAWWHSTPDAHLVVSVPNVRHWRVVNSLLRGNWPYWSAGVLDDTHRWFYTRGEVERMLWRAGWDVESVRFSMDEGEMKKALAAGNWIAFDELHYRPVDEADKQEFLAQQWLMRAQKARLDTYGKVGLVMVCWNQWSYTEAALYSLRRSLRIPVQLVVVDNGSTDETDEMLAEWSRQWPALQVIHNEANAGWIVAVNQGLEALAGCDYYVVLNNDVLFPTGWLEPLLDALGQTIDGKPVGIAGPLSNRVSGPQCISVGYQSELDMDGWVWRYVRQWSGKLQPFDRLVGFCMALSAASHEKIGPMDIRYGIGLCDDDDWCLKAREEGFATAIALGSFVHHYCHVTFDAQVPDWRKRMNANWARLQEKWPGYEPFSNLPSNM